MDIATDQTAPRFGLLIIGDEILSGKRPDKHFARVIELLSARGLQLSWAQYLPDERDTITATLRRTFALAADGREVVFSCGGIGSTSDDHTRQAAAAALSLPLALHPEAQRLITERCVEMASEGRGSTDMSTTENRQRLTMGEFPHGARIIANPYNRIPGFSIGGHWFVPGFPVMAWPMIESVLDAHFAPWFHLDPQAERSMLVFETPESAIAPLMVRVEAEHRGVRAFSLPSVGDGRDGMPARRHIELGVKGPRGSVDAAFDLLVSSVRKIGAPFELE